MRIVLIYLLCCVSGLYAATAEQAQVHAQSSQQQLSASSLAAQQWLDLVDKNKYEDSWNQASTLMKRTVSQKEWQKILNATRKPLGGVGKRTMIHQAPAQNPKNMPKGDYMVILYQTTYTGSAPKKELLTLSFEHGEWRVITYMIDK